MRGRQWSQVLQLAVVLLLAANLMVMVVGKPKPAYAAAAPQGHQYKVISAAQTPRDLQQALDEAGAEGWNYEGSVAGSASSYPFVILSK